MRAAGERGRRMNVIGNAGPQAVGRKPLATDPLCVAFLGLSFLTTWMATRFESLIDKGELGKDVQRFGFLRGPRRPGNGLLDDRVEDAAGGTTL